MSCAPVPFSLRNSAGDLEYQGTSSSNPASPTSEGYVNAISPLFLASGGHQVTAVTVPADCLFLVEVTPWAGPLGGGAQGFALPSRPGKVTPTLNSAPEPHLQTCPNPLPTGDRCSGGYLVYGSPQAFGWSVTPAPPSDGSAPKQNAP